MCWGVLSGQLSLEAFTEKWQHFNVCVCVCVCVCLCVCVCVCVIAQHSCTPDTQVPFVQNRAKELVHDLPPNIQKPTASPLRN